MNAIRRVVSCLAAALVVAVAGAAFAAAIPQSPILFDKLNRIHPRNLANPLTPASFNYPAAVNMKVERETKSRRGGQPPDEFHDKVKMDPPLAAPATMDLEIGDQNKKVRAFTFDHLHFHRTAEHLDSPNLNVLHSMEMHIVHTRAPDDANDTLPTRAVAGRWIDVLLDPVGPGFNPHFGHNPDLERLFNAFELYVPGAANTVLNFNMQKLLPNAAHFEHYRYTGSLTTGEKQIAGQSANLLVWNNLPGPPVVAANETWVSDAAVEWVMFEQPLTISLAQWTQYSSFIFGVDNHFGAQYGRSPFSHLFAVWDRTPGHDLRYVAIPEPGAVTLLAIVGAAAALARGRRERAAPRGPMATAA
ncbi:MAG TPA: carbonic anhydrase family protein [Lacipirellulaceae bacterium]|nr:carbonic anhydrase family protein [Lacipirellulaceae bacterium]HMP08303.1 carbonic anhydrase family protein [Lacipirellulaceae bacterium]